MTSREVCRDSHNMYVMLFFTRWSRVSAVAVRNYGFRTAHATATAYCFQATPSVAAPLLLRLS